MSKQVDIINLKMATVTIDGYTLEVPDYNYYLENDYNPKDFVISDGVLSNQDIKYGAKFVIGDFYIYVEKDSLLLAKNKFSIKAISDFNNEFKWIKRLIDTALESGFVSLFRERSFMKDNYPDFMSNYLKNLTDTYNIQSPDIDVSFKGSYTEYGRFETEEACHIKTMNAFNKSKYPQFWSKNSKYGKDIETWAIPLGYGYNSKEVRWIYPDYSNTVVNDNSYTDEYFQYNLSNMDEMRYDKLFLIDLNVAKELKDRANDIILPYLTKLVGLKNEEESLENEYVKAKQNLNSIAERTTNLVIKNENPLVVASIQKLLLKSVNDLKENESRNIELSKKF